MHQVEHFMRTCDAAAQVLRETNNPAVMWGDEGLLHMIAARARLRCSGRSWQTSQAVLNNLARQPGELVPGFTSLFNGRRVRIFHLPEHTGPENQLCGFEAETSTHHEDHVLPADAQADRGSDTHP